MAIEIDGMTPLQVFDMPTSLKFYCQVLGCEVVTTDGRPAPNCDWILLRLEETELMLNTAYEAPRRPPSPEPKRVAAHEDTCLYFACPDVNAAYHYLSGMGVKARKPKVAPVRDEAVVHHRSRRVRAVFPVEGCLSLLVWGARAARAEAALKDDKLMVQFC